MKQHGIMRFEGTFDDVTFFKSADGYLARRKGGVNKERINNDPRFARVRENGKEFGSAAESGKLLRDTVNSWMNNTKDSRLVSRMLQMMSKIVKLDNISARGSRNVGVGIGLPAGKALLNGTEFNIRSNMSTVLMKPYVLNPVDGKITITNLVPITDVRVPEGSTHLSLSAAFANVNFATLVTDIEYSNVENLVINDTASTLNLNPAGVPVGTGTKIYLLQIEFFQEVNGVQYELNNGGFNSMVIINVA